MSPKHSLPLTRIYINFITFSCIFDAAAIGQYLGGVCNSETGL
jgi:hypothetical protein